MTSKTNPHGLEAFADHTDCDVEAQCEVYETFRTTIEDDVVLIYKNTHYEVTSLAWFCLDHCVNLTDPPEHEWNT